MIICNGKHNNINWHIPGEEANELTQNQLDSDNILIVLKTKQLSVQTA
jgi:hypothetical protein